jgi:hypothetical protein
MFRRRRSADDFAQEIQSHLELEADELQREGMSADEARRRAKVEFGNVRAAEERFYLKGRAEWVDNLLRDLQFALRQMVKNPGFAVTAILVLALGIGASVAIFAFVDAALLEPLPYANPTRLMSVNESSSESPVWPLSYPDFLDWQRLNRSFTSLAIYSGRGFLLHAQSGVEPVQGERVSRGFFQTLGVRPILGRDFNPGENQLNGPDVVILSYGTWLRRFGERREVVGQTVDLDDRPHTIIGVLPRTFSFAPSGGAEFWVPINSLSPHEHSRTFYPFMGVGRLRDGIMVEAARAEMTAVAAAEHLQPRGAHTAGCGDAAAAAGEQASPDRSRPRPIRRSDHECEDRYHTGRPAAPVLRVAGGRLCCDRSGAGCGRALRSHRVFD